MDFLSPSAHISRWDFIIQRVTTYVILGSLFLTGTMVPLDSELSGTDAALWAMVLALAVQQLITIARRIKTLQWSKLSWFLYFIPFVGLFADLILAFAPEPMPNREFRRYERNSSAWKPPEQGGVQGISLNGKPLTIDQARGNGVTQ